MRFTHLILYETYAKFARGKTLQKLSPAIVPMVWIFADELCQHSLHLQV